MVWALVYLKAVVGPIELSFGGWLSHGQSCRVSYFYIKDQILMTTAKISNQNVQSREIEEKIIYCSLKYYLQTLTTKS